MVILGQKQVLQLTSGVRNQKEDSKRVIGWRKKRLRFGKDKMAEVGWKLKLPEAKPSGFPRLQSTNIGDITDECPWGLGRVSSTGVVV